MTQLHQIQKNSDFKLKIELRIEAQNCRAMILRFVGLVATSVAIGVKIALLLIGRAH